MDDVPQQRMLASLRQTFNVRLPDGLTPQAEARLRRTVGHFRAQVTEKQGTLNEQEVLRLSYDSMVDWFRRNTQFVRPPPVEIERAVLPDSVPATGPFDGEVDPSVLFAQMIADRQAAMGPAPGSGGMGVGGKTLLDELQPLESSSSRQLPAHLLGVETRVRPPADLKMPVPIETRTPPPAYERVQPKDFITRQEDVVKYREVESNLLLNSKDRDWLNQAKQNRYNFSIVLDGTSRPQGTGAQATILNRFRNIVRLEFIKAILPVESLDLVVPCTEAGPPSTFYSVLGLPFINVTLDEYTGNNYGTDDSIDRSFAICQYDATWRSDQFQTNDNTSRGFTLFFPKFMKAQRVYAPTPLSSFTKLTFQLLDPENNLLSTAPDAYAVAKILFGSETTGSCSDASGSYLFIQTKEFFPLWAYSQLDKIQFGGLTFTDASGTIQAGGSALIQWLQRDQGNIVVGVGYTTDGVTITDDGNADGYANVIIIRNRFGPPDPTTGVVTLLPFTPGGDDTALATALAAYPASYQDGGVLNLNRQVQLVLRVVTRELDPTTNVRPDNV
jgi:hypothetical protein